jgi:pSer/pThr/pTyr-binding forkhead associated (FHA) protein
VPAIATLQLLDGTLIARLSCDEECGVIVIGRDKLSDVRISDPYVHRSHAEIHWDLETRSHIFSHSGGENGSWVNLQRVNAPARLTDGSRIRVGKTELIYRRIHV